MDKLKSFFKSAFVNAHVRTTSIIVGSFLAVFIFFYLLVLYTSQVFVIGILSIATYCLYSVYKVIYSEVVRRGKR